MTPAPLILPRFDFLFPMAGRDGMRAAPVEWTHNPALVRAGREGDCVRGRGQVKTALAALLLLGLLIPCGRGQTAAAPDAPVADPPTVHDAPVWGVAGFRAYAMGEQVAPNGLEFHPLFNLDLDFNFWVWRSERVYIFADDVFWAQRARPASPIRRRERSTLASASST